MTRDDLNALIARVEAAEGPDRELDAEIAWLVHPPERRRLNLNPVQRECFHLGLQPPQWVPWDSVASFHPAYTASRDAAASLGAEGWLVELLVQHPTYWAMKLRRLRDGLLVSGRGETEQTCRTAAALRARLAETSDE